MLIFNIGKSPFRRMHMDENLEKLRGTFSNVRDLSILELLIYTDMKIGELTMLNISNMDYINKVYYTYNDNR